MKSVKLYQFKEHNHDYQYVYSIEEYKMYIVHDEDNKRCLDRCILTKNDIVHLVDESQITLEALLIDELMTIDIKHDSVEFVDVALGIIDALMKKDKDYV